MGAGLRSSMAARTLHVLVRFALLHEAGRGPLVSYAHLASHHAHVYSPLLPSNSVQIHHCTRSSVCRHVPRPTTAPEPGSGCCSLSRLEHVTLLLLLLLCDGVEGAGQKVVVLLPGLSFVGCLSLGVVDAV